MGCVQNKNQKLVAYESSMGAHFAAITGKDIEIPSIIVGGVTPSDEQRAFTYDLASSQFKPLTIPDGMLLWNYASIVQLSAKEIMITGGLSASASEISNQAYIYDTTTCKAIRLPSMMCPRYTHISTFFKGKLYTIGGRDYGDDDNTAIQSHCERFNFNTHKWEKIAKLKTPRCTGFAFIYKDAIHVCGGLTGKMHRSRSIERYDEQNDTWVTLDFKLSRGIECGTLLPARHLFAGESFAKDSFVIVGGNTEEGSQDSVFIYNLAARTVISAASLKQQRVLQKTLAYQNHVVVFGGSETDGIETFDRATESWKENLAISFAEFIGPNDIDQFSYSQPPIVIPDISNLNTLKSSQLSFSSASEAEKQDYIGEVVSSRSFSGGAAVRATNVSINGRENIKNHIQHSQRLDDKHGNDSTHDHSLGSVKQQIKDDILVEKAYLFGTDIDPFILEIDFLNLNIEKKPVPLAMRLFEHQGVAKSPESPSQYILMGGVHDGMNKSVKYTYAYDAATSSAKRLPNMVFSAYAFAVLCEGRFIYAIGGKQSGLQHESLPHGQHKPKQQQQQQEPSSTILSVCQRFDTKTNEWTKMPNLNVKRVSSMALLMFGKIFVFGGFKGDSEQVRPNEIEVLDLESPRPSWTILSVRFPIGLEGAHLLHLSRVPSEAQSQQQCGQVLVLGGRTSSGEIKYISKLTFELQQEILGSETQTEQGEQQSEANSSNDELKALATNVKLDKVGQMMQSRCLHKVIQPYKSCALVLGGSHEPVVECVDVEKNFSMTIFSGKVSHLEQIVQKLKSAIKKVKDPSLKQYSLAF